MNAAVAEVAMEAYSLIQALLDPESMAITTIRYTITPNNAAITVQS